MDQLAAIVTENDEYIEDSKGQLCVAVTNWSTEAAGIAQLRRSKTLPPVAFDPFGDGRWEDVHRGALSTRAAGVPC